MSDAPSAPQAALAYLGLGWAVIPVHTPRPGGCSCGRADCPSPGKHPRVRWTPYTDRLPRAERIREWWSRWPDANVAVVTGAVSGVAVLDVDPRGGGEESLADLEARWGRLPATVETRTGGGGRHLWFALEGAELASAAPAPGLEVKAEGGAVVTPPSRHASGERYEWAEGRSPWELAPAPIPAWLAALARGTDGEGGAPGHPLAGAPSRTQAEREEFAELWRRAGVELRGGDRYYLCPFHDDHRPSLHIDADGCRWFCFGCRRGGGAVRLRRLLGEEPAGPARARLVGRIGGPREPSLHGEQEVDVVGESRHQDELLTLAGGARRYGGVELEAVADLVPEPGNPADPDAVAVVIAGTRVGYLRRADALRLRPVIDDGLARDGEASCRALIRGGWDRGRDDVGLFGVVLRCPPAPA